MLDLHQNSRTVTRLGFIAKARGDVGHCADGGVVEPALETDCAKGSEAMRDTNAEASVVMTGFRLAVRALPQEQY